MKAVGLYDPAYEHDAVRRRVRRPAGRRREPRDGRARRDGARQSRAPRRRGRRRRHRRRCGHDAAAAGRAVSRRDRRRAAAARSVRRRGVLPARATPSAPRRSSGSWPRRSRRRGRRSSRGATSRSTSATRARRPPRPLRASGSSSSRPRRGSTLDDFERKLYVIRRVAELAAGPDLVDPELLGPHRGLQGDADGAAAGRATTRICGTSAPPRRSCSCTPATRPTPSRAGSSRTRTG